MVINYPQPDFRLRKRAGKEEIFDSFRKKWVALTPEEWVRQNFIHYLIKVRNYPAALIAVEKEIRLGELKKRFDILVYDGHHQPWMMVECKAPAVKPGETVLQQVLRYTISLPVRYIIITNGSLTLGWEKSHQELLPIRELPELQ